MSEIKDAFAYRDGLDLTVGFFEKEFWITENDGNILIFDEDAELIKKYHGIADHEKLDNIKSDDFRRGLMSHNGYLVLARSYLHEGIALLDPGGNPLWGFSEETLGLIFDERNNVVYANIGGFRWESSIRIRDIKGNLILNYPENPGSVPADPFHPYPHEAEAIILDYEGNIVFAGEKRDWIKFVKIDRDGNVLWADYYAGRISVARDSFITDKSGNLYYGKVSPDASLMKRNADGERVWEWIGLRDQLSSDSAVATIQQIGMDGEENIYIGTSNHPDYGGYSVFMKISSDPDIEIVHDIEYEPIGDVWTYDDYGNKFYAKWPPIDETSNVVVHFGGEDEDGNEYRIEIPESEYTINYETGEIELNEDPRDWPDVNTSSAVELTYRSVPGRPTVASVEWVWTGYEPITGTPLMAVTEGGQVFVTTMWGDEVLKIDTSQAPTDGSEFDDREWTFYDEEEFGRISFVWGKRRFDKWLAEKIEDEVGGN